MVRVLQTAADLMERLRRSWRELKNSKPGRRFQDRYERRQRASGGGWTLGTIANVVLGLVVAAGGLFLIPAPGPGWLITFVGLGLLGSEFAPIARTLDWAEVKGRAIGRWSRRQWEHAPMPIKAMLVLFALAGVAGLAYGAFVLFVD